MSLGILGPQTESLSLMNGLLLKIAKVYKNCSSGVAVNQSGVHIGCGGHGRALAYYAIASATKFAILLTNLYVPFLLSYQLNI